MRVCSISLPLSIRWTMSACRRHTGSARPRFIGFGPISAIADRQSSRTRSFQASALSAVASLKVPCSGRCCSCSTPPTLVRLLRVSAYHLTSTLMTLSFTRGALHRQQRRRMELGLERIAECMRSNRLRLNPEKTDFPWCATRRRCIHLDTGELSACGALIRPSTSVRDLVVLLESGLSTRRHVEWTVGCCFRQLRLIRSYIKSLPHGAAKAAVSAFFTSPIYHS